MPEIREMDVGELEMELRRMRATDIREVGRDVLTWADGRIHLVYRAEEPAWEAIDTLTGRLSRELTDIGHLEELVDEVFRIEARKRDEEKVEAEWDMMFGWAPE